MILMYSASKEAQADVLHVQYRTQTHCTTQREIQPKEGLPEILVQPATALFLHLSTACTFGPEPCALFCLAKQLNHLRPHPQH